MTDNLGDTSNVANFTLRLGYMCASFEDDRVIAYLKNCGCNQALIDEAHDALFKVAREIMKSR
jgi:hypothetical protein